MSTNLKIEKILEGKKAGRMQKVGVMQIIPIFYKSNDLANYKIVTPRQAMKMKTNDYGTMNLKNEDPERTLITPNHMGVMTKKEAQDHGMCKTGVIAPSSRVSYNDAFCIEQSQSGYIPEDNYEFIVMPWALRHKIVSMGKSTGYNRLWNEIASFNHQMQVNRDGAHLVYFYEKYNDDLGEFIAQFENLSKQIGAIIMIDNKVVGLEITPNPEYWDDVWEPLIRGCYGVETIRRLLLKQVSASDNVTLSDNITQSTTFEELENSVYNFEEEEKKIVQDIVNEIMSQDLKLTLDYKTNNDYSVQDVANQHYVGQVVMEKDFVVYASLVANAGRMLKNSSFAF